MASKAISSSKILAAVAPIILALVGALWLLLLSRVGDVEEQIVQVEARQGVAMKRLEQDIRELRADVKVLLRGGVSIGPASL